MRQLVYYHNSVTNYKSSVSMHVYAIASVECLYSQFWTDCSFSTSHQVLLHPHAKLTKLDFKLVWIVAPNSVFNPSLLLVHPTLCTSVHTLPITFHTKPSRCIFQQYTWNIQNMATTTLLMMICYLCCVQETPRRNLQTTFTHHHQHTETQLQNDSSYSLVEKWLLWFAFTLAFYGFLRASEFNSSNLLRSDIQLQYL